MARIRSKTISLQRLSSRPDSSIVVRLMMAFNDLVIANRGQGLYNSDLGVTEKHLKLGADMYFIRLQMSHLFEGVDIIEDLNGSNSLRKELAFCDPACQEAYNRLLRYTRGSADRKWFEANVGNARHNLTFHYQKSGKWIQWAVDDRSSRVQSERSSITRGDVGHLWRFNVADDILDSIMCRKIWKIPKTANVRKEADAIADRIHHVFQDFMTFAGSFVWHYLS